MDELLETAPWDGSRLCPECAARQQADRAAPDITTTGGWCAPADAHYTGMDPVCRIMPTPTPAHVWLWNRIRNRYRSWDGPWWHALRDFREAQAEAGTTLHGYPTPLTLPTIQVKRGGIQFGAS